MSNRKQSVRKGAASPTPSPIDDPQLYAVLLERLGQAATLVLDRNSTIRYVSERAERLIGKKAEHILGEPFFDAVVLCDDEGVPLPDRKRPTWQALHTKDFNQITPFFTKFKKTEDALVPVAVRAIQLKSARTITGAIVELREVKRTLNVGEMKTLFVSFAAHQLKTPSSIVKGFLELMLREGQDAYSKRQWYNLQSAFEANERLIHLSKTLLNLTRLEGGLIEPKIAPFAPASLLQQKIKTHDYLLKIKGVEVELDVKPTQSFFHSDETFFSEIFEVLFSNALKYAPENSVIRINCTVRKELIKVEVHDQGPGITREEETLLFQAAASAEPEQDSHGLGLLMAKKYVSLLGGSIGVRRDKRQQGARFFFTLPRPLM